MVVVVVLDVLYYSKVTNPSHSIAQGMFEWEAFPKMELFPARASAARSGVRQAALSNIGRMAGMALLSWLCLKRPGKTVAVAFATCWSALVFHGISIRLIEICVGR